MDTIWLLTIEHRLGTDHWVCATEAVAQSYLDNHVQQWWEDELEDEEMPADPSERAERYFEKTAESFEPEEYFIEEAPVLVV